MKTLITILMTFCTISHAELYELEVKGSSNPTEKPYISNQKGFRLHLVDVQSKDELISGLFTVPNEFGEIESAMLILIDDDGRNIAKSVLGAQILDEDTKNYEFYLNPDCIKNSYILVSHRDGDDLHIAKALFSSFQVQKAAEQGAAANP